MTDEHHAMTTRRRLHETVGELPGMDDTLDANAVPTGWLVIATFMAPDGGHFMNTYSSGLGGDTDLLSWAAKGLRAALDQEMFGPLDPDEEEDE
jgi:hypothetical protein